MARIPVAVLGSGPAGLFAALAAVQTGCMPTVYSLGVKSEMFGAMYLHEPIPGVNGDRLTPDFEVDVIKSGTAEGYAQKVYGNPGAPVSWNHIPSGIHPAWDLKAAYDFLWDQFSPYITKIELDAEIVSNICGNFPLVFSTVPAPALCRREHTFTKQDIWVVHGPSRGTIFDAEGNSDIMYYDGNPEYVSGYGWYRFSQIRGYQAWEYSFKPEVAEEISWGRKLVQGIKPLENNCDCFTGWKNYHRLGRFGEWQKGVLTHHAYRQASEILRHAL